MKKFEVRKGAVYAVLALLAFTALAVSCAPPEVTSAKLYMNNKDWVNARARLEQAVALYPDNAEAHMIFGQLETQEQNWAEAKLHYDKAAALSPIHAREVERLLEALWQNHYADGSAFLQRDDFASAEASYTIATILLPERREAWNNLAVVYGRQDDFDRAIEMYNKVLEIDQTDTLARKNTGFMYYNQQKYAECISYLEPLAEEFIGDPDFVTSLGFSYMRTEQNQRAIDLFEGALDLDPDNLVNHMNMALLYAQDGDNIKAEPHFLRVIELNPFDTEAMLQLAYTYIEREEEAKAFPYLEKLVELDPNNPDTIRQLGIYYVRRGASSGNQDDIAKGQALMLRADQLDVILGKDDPPPPPPIPPLL